MKKLKRTLCALLAVVFLSGLIPQSVVFAADNGGAAVERLEIVENDYKYVENDLSSGWFSEDGFHYDPFISFIYLKLRATYADGSTREFSFFDKDGNFIEDIDIEDYPSIDVSNVGECMWEVGTTENAYTVVYGGASVSVPVTVIESLVEKIDIIENNYVYIKNDRAESFTVADEQGNETVVYLPDNSLLGLRLRIYYKNGDTEDFCLGDKIPADCTDEEFSSLAEEMLMLNGYAFTYAAYDQEQNPWTVGGSNSYIVSYMGVSVDVPVKIVESPVIGISVVENPFKYTMNDDRLGQTVGGEYGDEFFKYDETYSFAYSLFKIDYSDGTFEYYRPVKSDGFNLHNGYEFVVGTPDQFEKPWTEGENSCTICYMGKEVVIPVTVVSSVPVDSSSVFTDVGAGRWYKPYIDEAVTYGLFNGVTKTTFVPGGEMNRAMFVQVLANMSGVKTDKNAETGFKDVSVGRWYTGAVAWAAQFGIVNGISETEFAPLSNVTREQMCTMLVRYADHVGVELQKDVAVKTFADDADISKYAKDAVYACQQAGIIDGMTETEFAPKDTATRAQVAKILSVFHFSYMS